MLHLMHYFFIDWYFIVSDVQSKTANFGEIGKPRVLTYTFEP